MLGATAYILRPQSVGDLIQLKEPTSLAVRFRVWFTDKELTAF
jgi:hypothetical protein